MVLTFLGILARHAVPITGAGIFLGLLSPDLAALLRPALEACVVIVMTVAFSRLEWAGLDALRRKRLATTLVVAWVFVAAPVLIWAVGTAIGVAGVLLAAIVLNAAAAPIVTSVPYCQLLDLDAELAMLVVLITTFLMPLILPAMILVLLGLEVVIDPAVFLPRIGLFILLPLALAWTIRRVVPATRLDAAGATLDGIMVFVLIVFAVGIMDGVTAQILNDPAKGAATLAAVFGVSILLHAVSGLLFWSFGKRTALSVAVTGGSRNLALLLVIVGDTLGPDFALYVALGQLPIYLMPVAVQIARRRMLRLSPPSDA